MKHVIYSIIVAISILFSGFGLIHSGGNDPSRELSDTLDAIHYEINLRVVDLAGHYISGNTVVTLTSRVNNLSVISLNLLDLNVDSCFVNGAYVQGFLYDGSTLQIPLSTPLNIDDTVVAHVYYQGVPYVDPSVWGGFHFTSGYAFNLGVGFESDPHNLGRAWFPGIDDFIDKALYDYYITVNSNHKAICGGILQSVTANPDTTSTYHWSMEHPVPAYLASVAVGAYEEVGDTFLGMNGSVPISIFVRPADTVKVAGSFVHLKEVLEFYETCFGPYPFERVGFTGTNIGAMEHAANIFLPHGTINGSLGYEELIMHELSHMYFGDDVTCSSAEDMWLNEGWATWCESLYKEGVYDKEAAAAYTRSLLRNVLQLTHIKDAGYRALYGIPNAYTYGSTVYDKGALVVHTLRYYLGDSLFFPAMKDFLQDYAFQSVSSWDLRDYLTAHTGVNLNDFFDTWVFTPGFPNYSVDSFQVSQSGSNFQCKVFVKQKSKGTSTLANSNILEITFMDDQWNMYSDTMHFSGGNGEKVFDVPFLPVVSMADYHEKICDATTDFYRKLFAAGEKDFPETYFSIIVDDITDSAFIRVTHNWVEPDSLKTAVPGLRLSDYRYWKVEGVLPSQFSARGKFFYSKANYLDNTLFTGGSADSVVLLYRESPEHDWHGISQIREGSINIGNIIIDTLRTGEYTLAVWDLNYLGTRDHIPGENSMLWIYPNPSNSLIHIMIPETKQGSVLKILNSSGRVVLEKPVSAGIKQSDWIPDGNLSNGLYHVMMITGKDQIYTGKVLINR